MGADFGGLSVDLVEWLLVAVLLLSFGAFLLAAVFYRQDKLIFAIPGIALLVPLLAGRAWGWDEEELLLMLLAMACAAGAAGYVALRGRWAGFSPGAALAGATANILLLPCWMGLLGLQGERSPWFLVAIPVLLVSALLVVGVAVVLRRLAVAVATAPAGQQPAGQQPAAAESTEDRQTILQLLASGEVTAVEAEQLLEAVRPAVPADRRPLTPPALATTAGALLVAIGFVLPWARVQAGPISGYRAGYHAGLLGWFVLALALLPALLAAAPALDRYIRKALAGLIFSAVGTALVGSLMAQALVAGRAPGAGLFVILLGFLFQVFTSALVLTVPARATTGRTA